MDLYKTIFKVNTLMVQLSTRFSWSVKLESKQARETIKTISKVLRVAKETIRTHVRKKT